MLGMTGVKADGSTEAASQGFHAINEKAGAFADYCRKRPCLWSRFTFWHLYVLRTEGLGHYSYARELYLKPARVYFHIIIVPRGKLYGVGRIQTYSYFLHTLIWNRFRFRVNPRQKKVKNGAFKGFCLFNQMQYSQALLFVLWSHCFDGLCKSSALCAPSVMLSMCLTCDSSLRGLNLPMKEPRIPAPLLISPYLHSREIACV